MTKLKTSAIIFALFGISLAIMGDKNTSLLMMALSAVMLLSSFIADKE